VIWGRPGLKDTSCRDGNERCQTDRMGQSQSRIRSKARVAADSNDLIEIREPKYFSGWFGGYTISASDKWLVMELVDDNVWQLEGFVCVRLRDVTRIRTQGEFSRSALRHFGIERPSATPALNAESTKSLVDSAAKIFPVLGIQCVTNKSEGLWFGTEVTVRNGKLKMRLISPKRKLRKKSTSFALSSITLIQFGGRYEQVLAALHTPD